MQLLIEQECGNAGFAGLALTPMDSPLAVDDDATVTAVSHRGSSSGGYLEHVFRGAASTIFGVVSINNQNKRNAIQDQGKK